MPRPLTYTEPDLDKFTYQVAYGLRCGYIGTSKPRKGYLKHLRLSSRRILKKRKQKAMLKFLGERK